LSAARSGLQLQPLDSCFPGHGSDDGEDPGVSCSHSHGTTHSVDASDHDLYTSQSSGRGSISESSCASSTSWSPTSSPIQEDLVPGLDDEDADDDLLMEAVDSVLMDQNILDYFSFDPSIESKNMQVNQEAIKLSRVTSFPVKTEVISPEESLQVKPGMDGSLEQLFPDLI